jgi:type II secretory pathway component PulF
MKKGKNPSLIEYEDEKRKKQAKDEDEKRKNRLLQIIIPSITAIIGAVIGWILTNLLIH